jgi:hypothetical protein
LKEHAAYILRVEVNYVGKVACCIDIRGEEVVMAYWNSQSEQGIREN